MEEVKTGRRDYRLALAAEGKDEQNAIVEIVKILQRNFGDLFTWDMLNANVLCMAFRLLSRSAAAVHHYLRRRHQKYPYKLFNVLNAKDEYGQHDQDVAIALARSIVNDHPCCRCEFTNWFLEDCCNIQAKRQSGQSEGSGHDKEKQLDLDEEQDTEKNISLLLDQCEILEAIAAQTTTDIAATECKHAANRRSIKSKTVQTHSHPVSDCSSHFIARHFRNSTFVGFHGFKAAPHRYNTGKDSFQRRRGPLRIPRKTSSRFAKHIQTKKQPLKRGGGAWSIFLSENPGPLPKTALGKTVRGELSAKYRSLGPEERSRLQGLAEIVKRAQRAGGKRVVGAFKRNQAKGAKCLRRLLPPASAAQQPLALEAGVPDPSDDLSRLSDPAAADPTAALVPASASSSASASVSILSLPIPAVTHSCEQLMKVERAKSLRQSLCCIGPGIVTLTL